MLERLFGVFHGSINLLSYSDALENRLNVDQFDGQFEPARKRMRYSRTENAMRYVLFSTILIAIGLNHYEFDLANLATARNDTEIINGLEMEKKIIRIGEFRKQCGNELTKTKNCFNIGIKDFTDERNYEIVQIGFDYFPQFPHAYDPTKKPPVFTKCLDDCYSQKFKETCRNSELPFFCKVKFYKESLKKIKKLKKISILTKIGIIISKRVAELEKPELWKIGSMAAHTEEPLYHWPFLLFLLLFVIFVSQLGPKGYLTALFIYIICMMMIDHTLIMISWGSEYLYLFGSKMSKFLEILCTIY